MKTLLLLALALAAFSTLLDAQIRPGIPSTYGDPASIEEALYKLEDVRRLVYNPLHSTGYEWDGTNWFHSYDDQSTYDPTTCLLSTSILYSPYGMPEHMELYNYTALLAFLTPDLVTFPSDVTTSNWNGWDWVFESRAYYTFYPSGEFKTFISLDAQLDTVYAFNYLRIYDGDNNPISTIRQSYNTNTHQFENKRQYVYQYYSPGYLKGILHSIFTSSVLFH